MDTNVTKTKTSMTKFCVIAKKISFFYQGFGSVTFYSAYPNTLDTQPPEQTISLNM